MRRNTQNTIIVRVLGIRRDRQDVAVVSVAHSMTVVLGLLFKRVCHYARGHHASSAWGSAWPTSCGLWGPEPVPAYPTANASPVLVETVAAGRC